MKKDYQFRNSVCPVCGRPVDGYNYVFMDKSCKVKIHQECKDLLSQSLCEEEFMTLVLCFGSEFEGGSRGVGML